MKRLEGKIAIVTGGGRGLGYGTARRLAREGATIAIAEIDEETGPIARAEIEKDFGVPVVFRRTDIGQEIDAKALVEEVYDQFGRIDILVNAAQGFTPLALIEDKTTRSEEHTSELQSLMRISYAVFCLKKKTKTRQ